MKQKVWWLAAAALAFSSALCAQETAVLNGSDLLAAFETYNPAVLEKAAQNPAYRQILDGLSSSYEMPKTEKNQYEMLALVKNFDYSLQLHVLKQAYTESLTLQQMTGTELTALDKQTHAQLEELLRAVYENTLQVRKQQKADYKARLKVLSKDETLSMEERTEAQTQLKKDIGAVKNEIKWLKSGHNRTIRAAADTYLTDWRTSWLDSQFVAFAPAAEQKLEAAQSSARSVKANHKKPVAK